MAKPALGRGLGALLGGVQSPTSSSADEPPTTQEATPDETDALAVTGDKVHRVSLDRIRPCPLQPRKEFSEESLQELAESIREQGILQPLIVRQMEDHFELIAGERRWRAAKVLELDEVPVIFRAADDQEVLELALIENLQRENLNVMEEAQGYAQLIEQFQLRQEDVAQRVGKSRSHVTNAMRLLKLPSPVQDHLREGAISMGHAKVILGLPDEEEQKLAAECILRDKLNVRQTEELVELFQNKSPEIPAPGATTGGSRKSSTPATRDAHVVNLENRLQERFGTKVQLKYRKGKGAIQIQFFNDDDLERILQTAGVSPD